MRQMRVLVLTHEDLVPPSSLRGLSKKEAQVFKKEFDVTGGLRELGHEVQVVGVSHDLLPIRQHVEEFQPHVVFHLLMEFQDIAVYQAHVASYLELLRVPYAGCNPRGLLLARDKALSKKIFRYYRIPAPAFHVFRLGRAVRVPKDLDYPSIVKTVDEEASLGIAQASIVRDEEKLRERIEFVHRRLGTDAIAEQYIHGRELTVSVIGNERLQTFPIWELFFDNLPPGSNPIATERAKWDREYQLRVGIATGPAEDLPEALARQIAHLAKRSYRALHLSGYARLDLRLTEDGKVYVIEANPNPDLRREEDFAASAAEAGLSYPQLLQRLLNLGLRHRSPWRTLEDA
ncbi:ATP-grasp domain-containing protein [Myxococcota bacterium]|nr:ATP-grasp domain-containing protein [Myxococcota bacterium]MCZ7619712.1 ATP-grasp domain-containing protein [Myxococcota bacterium]